MQVCKRRTGERMTYQVLAERTGIAQRTLQIIGSQDHYNAPLATLENICGNLDVTPGDLLEVIDDRPKPKRTPRKKRRT